MNKEKEIKNQAEILVVAQDFLASTEKKVNFLNATIIGLSGELGAGKTTFAQAVAKTLGITETVTSPTFVIEKIYEIPESAKSRFKHLIHIDAYRLENPNELVRLGFAEISADPANLILIEWAERLGGLLPTDTPHFHFFHINENTRKIRRD